MTLSISGRKNQLSYDTRKLIVRTPVCHLQPRGVAVDRRNGVLNRLSAHIKSVHGGLNLLRQALKLLQVRIQHFDLGALFGERRSARRNHPRYCTVQRLRWECKGLV